MKKYLGLFMSALLAVTIVPAVAAPATAASSSVKWTKAKVVRWVDGDTVETTKGTIRCETIVLACGLWTRDLAAQLGVRVPLYPCEHFYVVTEPLAAATPNLPVLRDTDGHIHVKEDAGKWLVGAFEPWGKALAMEKLPPNQPFIELAEDWDHFELPFTKAMEILTMTLEPF